jgi:hypothetical protein
VLEADTPKAERTEREAGDEISIMAHLGKYGRGDRNAFRGMLSRQVRR